MSNPYSQNPQQFSAPNNPDVYGGNGGYQQQTNNPQQGQLQAQQPIWNHQQHALYQGNVRPTNPNNPPVLQQGVQSNAHQTFPRASILHANANATYQGSPHPRQSTAIGGLPRPGYPTASPIIQRTRHPIGVRNPVSSSSIANFNAQTLIRTPSGLSIQKATVMTGSIGSGIHGVTRSLPTLPGGIQVHREPAGPIKSTADFQQPPNKTNLTRPQMVAPLPNIKHPPHSESISTIPHQRLTRLPPGITIDRTVVSQNPEVAINNSDKKKLLSSDIPGPSSYKPLVKHINPKEHGFELARVKMERSSPPLRSRLLEPNPLEQEEAANNLPPPSFRSRRSENIEKTTRSSETTKSVKYEAKPDELERNNTGSDSDTSDHSGGLSFIDRAKTRAKTVKWETFQKSSNDIIDNAEIKTMPKPREQIVSIERKKEADNADQETLNDDQKEEINYQWESVNSELREQVNDEQIPTTLNNDKPRAKDQKEVKIHEGKSSEINLDDGKELSISNIDTKGRVTEQSEDLEGLDTDSQHSKSSNEGRSSFKKPNDERQLTERSLDVTSNSGMSSNFPHHSSKKRYCPFNEELDSEDKVINSFSLKRRKSNGDQDSGSVDVFSDTASECSDASKRSSVKMNNEILEQQQYYQQQLTHYQNTPMVGKDTVCVFCLTRCSTKDKRPQLLTCLHSACLDCFKERVENVKNDRTEKKSKSKENSLKNEAGLQMTAHISHFTSDSDEDCCEIVVDCSETEAVVVPCLLCKVSTEENQVRDNLFLQFDANEIEDGDTKSPLCDSCEDQNIATSLCEDCKEHLCSDCVKAHQRVKMTKDHTITELIHNISKSGNIDESSSGAAYNLTCSTHENEKLSIFCTTCDVLTCRKCHLSGVHKSHKYQFSADVLPDVRSHAEQGIADIKLKKNVLDENKSLLGSKLSELTIKEKALLNQLKDVKSYLQTKIDARFKELKSDVIKALRGKRKAIESRKEILNRYYLTADYAHVFIDYALQQSSQSDDDSFAMLSSKQIIDKQIRRIKKLDPSSGLVDETSTWKLDLYFQQYSGQQLHSSLESVLKQVMGDVKVLDTPPYPSPSTREVPTVELGADSSNMDLSTTGAQSRFQQCRTPPSTAVVMQQHTPPPYNAPSLTGQRFMRGGSPVRGVRPTVRGGSPRGIPHSPNSIRGALLSRMPRLRGGMTRGTMLGRGMRNMGVSSPIKGTTSNARGSLQPTRGRGGVAMLETNNSQVTGATKRGGKHGRGRSRGTPSGTSSRGRGRIAQNSPQQFPLTSPQPTINIDHQKQPNVQASGGTMRMHGLQSQEQANQQQLMLQRNANNAYYQAAYVQPQQSQPNSHIIQPPLLQHQPGIRQPSHGQPIQPINQNIGIRSVEHMQAQPRPEQIIHKSPSQNPQPVHSNDSEDANESGGLAGLAWHTSPAKNSPGKSGAAKDNSFKITIPPSRPMSLQEGGEALLPFCLSPEIINLDEDQLNSPVSSPTEILHIDNLLHSASNSAEHIGLEAVIEKHSNSEEGTNTPSKQSSINSLLDFDSCIDTFPSTHIEHSEPMSISHFPIQFHSTNKEKISDENLVKNSKENKEINIDSIQQPCEVTPHVTLEQNASPIGSSTNNLPSSEESNGTGIVTNEEVIISESTQSLPKDSLQSVTKRSDSNDNTPTNITIEDTYTSTLSCEEKDNENKENSHDGEKLIVEKPTDNDLQSSMYSSTEEEQNLDSPEESISDKVPKAAVAVALEILNNDIEESDISKQTSGPIVSIHEDFAVPENVEELDTSKQTPMVSIHKDFLIPENTQSVGNLLNDGEVKKETTTNSKTPESSNFTNEKEVIEGANKEQEDKTNNSEKTSEKEESSNVKGTTRVLPDQIPELEGNKEKCTLQNETLSTSSVTIKEEIKEEPPELLGSAKDDGEEEGEEWCAVCHDGGDLLYCCDRCPKVYHLYCYIPPLKEEPPDDWVCLMCATRTEIDMFPNKRKRGGGKLGEKDLKICRRLMFEMHSFWPESWTFRDINDLDFDEYRRVVQEPIALDVIKNRLDSKCADQYSSIPEFLTDLRKMFYNCKKFHRKGTQWHAHARKLEDHLDKTLQEWLPQYAYEEYEPEESGSKDKLKPCNKSRRSDNSPSTSTSSKRQKMSSESEEVQSTSTSGKSTKKSTKSQQKNTHRSKRKSLWTEDDCSEEEFNPDIEIKSERGLDQLEEMEKTLDTSRTRKTRSRK